MVHWFETDSPKFWWQNCSCQSVHVLIVFDLGIIDTYIGLMVNISLRCLFQSRERQWSQFFQFSEQWEVTHTLTIVMATIITTVMVARTFLTQKSINPRYFSVFLIFIFKRLTVEYYILSWNSTATLAQWSKTILLFPRCPTPSNGCWPLLLLPTLSWSHLYVICLVDMNHRLILLVVLLCVYSDYCGNRAFGELEVRWTGLARTLNIKPT